MEKQPRTINDLLKLVGHSGFFQTIHYLSDVITSVLGPSQFHMGIYEKKTDKEKAKKINDEGL